MFGARADGDREAVAGRVGDVGRSLVAGRRHDHDAVFMGVGKRGDELGHIRRRDFAGELEAEVDDLGPAVDREAHPLGDRRSVAFAAGVEHPHRHDLHSICKARQPAAVVGGLRDRARHEGSVAVAVVRVGAVRHEVIAFDELGGFEVRRAQEGPAVLVGDPGVEHSHRHPAAAGGAVGDQVRPRFRRVHAEGPDEVPLQRAPVARGVADAGVVGDEAGRGDVGDVVGPGPQDGVAAPQARERGLDADAGPQREHARLAGCAGCGAAGGKAPPVLPRRFGGDRFAVAVCAGGL